MGQPSSAILGVACAVLRDREKLSVFRAFPVAFARGKHLFPFRTEQLSPSAPMVLGLKGPGRVGRRRSTFAARRAGFILRREGGGVLGAGTRGGGGGWPRRVGRARRRVPRGARLDVRRPLLSPAGFVL